jgi:hypothetical protein
MELRNRNWAAETRKPTTGRPCTICDLEPGLIAALRTSKGSSSLKPLTQHDGGNANLRSSGHGLTTCKRILR